MIRNVRREAAKLGERFFASATACKRCDGTQRYTVNGACVACNRARAAKDYAVFRDLLKAARESG